MKPKYLNYKLEQLLEEKSFIGWVLREENKQEWEEFLASNPSFSSKAERAREIIGLLKDRYEVPNENAVLAMWQNIDQYEQKYKHNLRKLTIRRSLSWAASVLLIVSLGTFGYLYLNEKRKDYQFVTSDAPHGREARIRLSTGEGIALKRENSTIAFNDAANQVAINDSIIDLTPTGKNAEQDVRMNEVVVPFGKRSELLLADGTRVWLNAGSRLAFPSKFNQKTREVYLEGEACFNVSKNENQPFVVNAGELDIRVLGTLFNVSAYASDTNIETVLIEGSVALQKSKTFGLAKNELKIKPNQRASYNKQNTDLNIYDQPDADLYIAWTEGWLQFSKESLRPVFTRIERYYDVQVVLPANFSSEELITGKLDLKDSMEEVMIVLADIAQIEYRIENNKVYIDKKMK